LLLNRLRLWEFGREGYPVEAGYIFVASVGQEVCHVLRAIGQFERSQRAASQNSVTARPGTEYTSVFVNRPRPLSPRYDERPARLRHDTASRTSV